MWPETKNNAFWGLPFAFRQYETWTRKITITDAYPCKRSLQRRFLANEKGASVMVTNDGENAFSPSSAIVADVSAAGRSQCALALLGGIAVVESALS